MTKTGTVRISAGIKIETFPKAKKLAKEAGVSLMQYVSDAVERRVKDVERKRQKRPAESAEQISK